VLIPFAGAVYQKGLSQLVCRKSTREPQTRRVYSARTQALELGYGTPSKITPFVGYNLEIPHLRPSISSPLGLLIDRNVSGFASQANNTMRERKRSARKGGFFSYRKEYTREGAILFIFSFKLPKSLLHLSFVIGSYVYCRGEVDSFRSFPILPFRSWKYFPSSKRAMKTLSQYSFWKKTSRVDLPVLRYMGME